MKTTPIIFISSVLSFFLAPVMTEASISGLPLQVKVNVTSAACHINDDIDSPTIEFGDIQADLVDGSNYTQQLPVKIICEGSIPAGSVQYMVKGTTSSFDSNSLKTDTAGLGIKVLNTDNTPLGINTWVAATPGQTLSLNVVPVKDNTATFGGGEFNATATLVVQMK